MGGGEPSNGPPAISATSRWISRASPKKTGNPNGFRREIGARECDRGRAVCDGGDFIFRDPCF